MSASERLRVLICTGEVSPEEAMRLCFRIGERIPRSERKEGLLNELRYALETLALADICGVSTPDVERGRALEALEAAERAMLR